MDVNDRQPKRQDNVLSSLNMAIDAMNTAKDALNMTPAKAAFGSVGVILTMIRVGFLSICHVGRGWLICAGLDDQRGRLRRARAGLR